MMECWIVGILGLENWDKGVMGKWGDWGIDIFKGTGESFLRRDGSKSRRKNKKLRMGG
jgi:hypothetical protein